VLSLPSIALDTRFPAGMTTFVYNDMPITCENLKAVIQKEYRRYGRFARTNPAPSDFLDEGVSASITARLLKVDQSFRQAIIKKSIDECVLKCVG
jgi:hypothetical protein